MAYLTIEKGDKFLCKKHFRMEDKSIEYTKGDTYTSECSNCITDNSGDVYHVMAGRRVNIKLDEFLSHFKLIK